MPDALRAGILEIGAEHVINDPGAAQISLASERVLPRTTYYFERVPDARDEPKAVLRDGCRVVHAEGVVVCTAWTAADNGVAAIVRVDTLPEFRGRGFARQATAAWVEDVLGAGRVPYYTHATDNLASQSLARSLGAIQFATGVKVM